MPVVARENEHVTLTCTVIGHPQPYTSWYRNNFCIDGCTDYVIVYDRKSGVCHLDIHSALSKHAGTYHCVAPNQHGRAVTQAEVYVSPLSDTNDSYSTLGSRSGYSDFTWKEFDELLYLSDLESQSQSASQRSCSKKEAL